MKRIVLFLFAFYAAAASLAAADRAALTAGLALTPERSGGIYYAYPVAADSLAPVPAGFEPLYVSHYGRHGSRWVIDMSIYPKVLGELRRQAEADNLTAQGQWMLAQAALCADHARGHSGELSPLGGRQHAAIARRLAGRLPGLLADTARIVMRSSTEPRCIISMAAFSEALKDCDSRLRIERHASPGDMAFIHYKSAEAKELGRPDAPWMQRFASVRDSLTACPTTAARIFRDPSRVENLPTVMRHLHDIAIDVQDVPDGLPAESADMLRVFAPDDLYNLWMASNYMMYVRHADATPGRDVGPRCAANLLRRIIADKDAAATRTAADLRFGHDTSIIPLLSLMGVEGCSPAGADSPEEAAALWQTYSVSPMAANLQLLFFRRADGREIVGLRLNEQPVRVAGVAEYAPGYYDWAALRDAWQQKLESLEN